MVKLPMRQTGSVRLSALRNLRTAEIVAIVFPLLIQGELVESVVCCLGSGLDFLRVNDIMLLGYF